MRFRPAFWPTFLALPAFLVLLGLGAWQVERLYWKEGLIAERAVALAAPVAALPRSLDEARGMEFRHVTARGEFLHEREFLLGASNEGGTTGYHVITPLRLGDGALLLVDRGWIPGNLKSPETRAAGQLKGIVTIEGLLRLPAAGRPNWFVPDNRCDINYWFWIDISGMARCGGLEGVLPFTVDAGPAANPGGYPRAASAGPHCPMTICNMRSLGLPSPPGSPRSICSIIAAWRGAARSDAMTAYQDLEKRFRRLGAVQEAAGILQWDSAALMPPGGAGARADQLATLKLVCHETLTDRAVGDLLEGAAAQNDLDAWQRANLREMQRQWRHATAVPGALVEAASLAASECEQIWRKARPASDFAMVRPALQRVLDLTREIAAAKAAQLGKSPYEALMDQYEPDAATAEIDRLFGDLAGFLPGLIDQVLARQQAARRRSSRPGPSRSRSSAPSR